jgi:hypothetical protein
MIGEKYIGLDVHQATICVAVMDAKGKVAMESILETKATTLLEFLAESQEIFIRSAGWSPPRPLFSALSRSPNARVPLDLSVWQIELLQERGRIEVP